MHLIFNSPAAYATAAPWLPVEAETTPVFFSVSVNDNSLLRAPLALNYPFTLLFSNLNQTFPFNNSENEKDRSKYVSLIWG